MTISWSSERGFTLVELMIAMVITMVGLMGLLRVVNMATEHNLKNQMREEAVLLAEEDMDKLRIRPFDQISTTFSPRAVPSRIRGFSKNYVVLRSSLNFPPAAATPTSKQIAVRIGWSYKNLSSHHEIRTMVANRQ